MWERLSELARGSSGSEELVLRELRQGRRSAYRAAAAQAGLHFRSYGSGRATVLVASTQPLPSYRADLVVAGGGRRSVVPVDEREVRARFDALARSGGELVLRENFGREGAAFVGELAARAGLHFRSYGKGINTVLVASTEPLPNYRADLDARHGTKQAEVSISGADAHRLEAALERVQRSSVLGDVGAGREGSSVHTRGARLWVSQGAAQRRRPPARAGMCRRTCGSAKHVAQTRAMVWSRMCQTAGTATAARQRRSRRPERTPERPPSPPPQVHRARPHSNCRSASARRCSRLPRGACWTSGESPPSTQRRATQRLRRTRWWS